MLLLAAPAVAALEVEVQASVDPTNWLVAELSAVDIFDEDLLNAVRSGLPARFRWRVEVWENRSGLWDRLAASAETELRLLYDALDEEYRILDRAGRAISHSTQLEVVSALLGEERLDLVPVEELADRTHYLVAELEIRPLTLEEVRDLERWLRGSREGGGIPGQLLGIVRQRLGLGDRSELKRGEGFRPRDLKGKS